MQRAKTDAKGPDRAKEDNKEEIRKSEDNAVQQIADPLSERLSRRPEDKPEPEPVKRAPVKSYVPPVKFPQRLKNKTQISTSLKFVSMFKKLHINIPFADALDRCQNMGSS